MSESAMIVHLPGGWLGRECCCCCLSHRGWRRCGGTALGVALGGWVGCAVVAAPGAGVVVGGPGGGTPPLVAVVA